MAISKLSLKALREQINAGTREVTFKTDDGAMTQMVYIPMFRIPAGLWENGNFPPRDLTLGGFFIDKYQCSHKNATGTSRGIGANPTIANGSTTNVAVSLPGKVPWTEINWNNAKQACANRKINGVSCHLVTMKEWATICFLVKLIGHDVRGNNNWGRDYRDADVFENYGVRDVNTDAYAQQNNKSVARLLTGSGPMSWSHNGMANGVFDIVGNVWEWVDFQMKDGVYTHTKKALINDPGGISSTDTAVVLDNMEDAGNWPANGLIKIKAEGSNTEEYIRYGNITYHGNGQATLSNCSRGQNGTTASAHSDNAEVEQLTDYCIIPGGCVAYINKTGGISNTDDTIPYTGLINGPGGNGFAVGDILQVETEQMTITQIVEGAIKVSRGANGSTAAAHANGVAIAKLSPQMSNTNPSSTDVNYGAYQFGYLETLRGEIDLASLALPFKSTAQTNEYKDGFWARWTGSRAALRGGDWHNASRARAGFALDLVPPPSDTYIYIGFRAALSLI